MTRGIRVRREGGDGKEDGIDDEERQVENSGQGESGQ